MYLIGIDIGTTHTKVGIYRPSGEEIYFKEVVTPFEREENGGKIPGDLLFSTILDLLGEFFVRFPEFRWERGCLSVSSLGETVIPVGVDNETISEGLIWYDRRTIPVYNEIIGKVGKKYFIERLLKNPGYFYSINKILWFKKKDPKLFSRVKWFLPVSSYIIFRFSHAACVDYSHAVRTMVFNPYIMDWDYEILKSLDIDPRIFPPLCESGTPLGHVLPEIKERLGIKGDILVSSGGHDHLVAALYMGVFNKNILFNSSGTTESIFLGIKRDSLDLIDTPSFLQKGDITCHTVPNYFTLIASMGTGGIAFKWFVEEILDRDSSFLSSLKYKENRVFFMPRVLEVHKDIPQSAFLSLGIKDNLHTLYSALSESLVFELRMRSFVLDEVCLKLPSVLRISGGPSKNEIYNQLKSDLFKKNVEIPKNTEATLFGAALLGGIGGGIYKSFKEAHYATYRIKEVYEPRENSYIFEKFQRYKELKILYDKILFKD